MFEARFAAAFVAVHEKLRDFTYSLQEQQNMMERFLPDEFMKWIVRSQDDNTGKCTVVSGLTQYIVLFDEDAKIALVSSDTEELLARVDIAAHNKTLHTVSIRRSDQQVDDWLSCTLQLNQYKQLNQARIVERM